jgi:hypothetical protein
MPDGMVELLPSLLVPTKSGPQTAVTATAIHIAVIASDAQTSLTRRARPSPAPEQPWRAGAKWSTSHTSSLMQTLARRSREGIRGNPDRGTGNPHAAAFRPRRGHIRGRTVGLDVAEIRDRNGLSPRVTGFY